MGALVTPRRYGRAGQVVPLSALSSVKSGRGAPFPSTLKANAALGETGGSSLLADADQHQRGSGDRADGVGRHAVKLLARGCVRTVTPVTKPITRRN
jgi:hypothetical protein